MFILESKRMAPLKFLMIISEATLSDICTMAAPSLLVRNLTWGNNNSGLVKPRPERWQHANVTHRNILGRNMLSAFGHPVATCWVLLAQIWPFSNLSQQHPTFRNTSQHGGQTHATCCAQQCWDKLRWHVAIVWSELIKSEMRNILLGRWQCIFLRKLLMLLTCTSKQWRGTKALS